jgi:hypothetical protein
MNKELQFVTTFMTDRGVPHVLLITGDFREAYKAGYEYFLKMAKDDDNDQLIAEIQPVLDLLNNETDPCNLGDQYIKAASECYAGYPTSFYIDSDICDSLYITISPCPDLTI